MSNIEDAMVKAKAKGLSAFSSSKDIDKSIERSNITLMSEITNVDDATLSSLKIISKESREKNILNEFRALRTTIIQKINKSNACIMVCSIIPDGGASYVSINLASSIALDEEKTALLINCDYQKDASYEKLLEQKNFGLTDYLTQDISPERIIYSTGIARLRIIPVGQVRNDVTEYFTKQKLVTLLEEIKYRYSDRFVIIDAPSANNLADLKLLSELSDYVIIVIPSAKVNNDEINNIVKSFDSDKFLGIVINDKQKFII